MVRLLQQPALPRPCTSGFPMTRAAELKPSDFPGGARPCPDHRLLSGIQWFLVPPWPPALTEKISAGGSMPRLGEPDVASMDCRVKGADWPPASR